MSRGQEQTGQSTQLICISL